MAKVLVSETNLTAIGNAIREKNGESTKYKPGEMAAAISAITTGGGDKITIGGRPGDFLNNNYWYGHIEANLDKFKLVNIYNCTNLLQIPGTKTKFLFSVPLKRRYDSDGNFVKNDCLFTGFAQNSSYLEELPEFTGEAISPGDWNYAFSRAQKLRNVDSLFDSSHLYVAEEYTIGTGFTQIFSYCYSLRSVPEFLMSNVKDCGKNVSTFYDNSFSYCYALDELVNFPVHTYNALTSNSFKNTFKYCSRLKNMIFETNEDGTPKVAQWKSQVIDLSTNVGWGTTSNITGYNSGITSDKLVSASNVWAAMKNDPDWYATDMGYSRYNLDSAIATINSLPDTSAYLATAGGTNTIKFKGSAGQNETYKDADGNQAFKSIKNLTEEQIAVAAAKGWTVTLA